MPFGRHRGRLALALLALGAQGAAGPLRFELVLEDDRSGEVLARLPLLVGEGVLYRYRHSVEGAVVEEGLVLDADGALYVCLSRSPHHGLGHFPRAGVPTLSPERPGWQAFAGLRLRLTPFCMFSGEPGLDDTALVWRGRTLGLSRLLPNRHLRWRVARVSAGAAWPR